MAKRKLGWGTSGDAMLLMFIKLVTMALGLTVTRLFSEYFSYHDYGTYSQILLIVNTVASITILGMVDGTNFFYCREKDPQKRESYVSTIFSFQCIVSAVAGCVVMALSAPLCIHFDNPDVAGLLIFAAVLPLMQNLISMLQVLVVSVGKARLLAARNLIVSVTRLLAVIAVITFFRDVTVVLLTTLALDLAQIGLFWLMLRKNGCPMGLRAVNFRLFKEIFHYCAPMAVFTVISTLNRDLDKYLVGLVTDTETLAVYANASKVLPFDIIITSFTTVLVPEITRRVAAGEKASAVTLYKAFLESSYIATGILCCGAIAAAPQLMQLLYSEKYLSGLTVFIIYILVDLLRFTNITLVLAVAGKTRWLMFLSFGTLAANALLNVLLYQLMGLPGPAVATLIVTLATGLLILSLSARVLDARLRNFFDLKCLAGFALVSAAAAFGMYRLQMLLASRGLHYVVVMVITAGIYGLFMAALYGKRLLRAWKTVNKVTKREDG
jgi:O-antigen/teichoic acid export membrane protein